MSTFLPNSPGVELSRLSQTTSFNTLFPTSSHKINAKIVSRAYYVECLRLKRLHDLYSSRAYNGTKQIYTYYIYVQYINVVEKQVS